MPAEEGALIVSDAEVLRRTAAGDALAFEQLVDRHEAAVLRYIHGLTRDPDRAEDALQETFIAAWRSADSFRGGESARAWLLSIARNCLHRQFRRRVGEPQLHVSLHDLALEAGWGSEGETLAARIEARDLVEKGFTGLTAEDREVLILRDLEGFTGEEVAEMLGLTLAAVKSRLHRARLRFTGSLREVTHHGL